MRRLAFMVVAAAGLAMAADAPQQDAVKAELEKMSGTYKLISAETDGVMASADVLKNSKLVIKGDEHDVKVGDDIYKGTHKIDPSKTPKTIDASDVEGVNKGKTMLGIYELTADELKVCFAPAGKDRPKEFSAKKGTGHMLHVWKREKP